MSLRRTLAFVTVAAVALALAGAAWSKIVPNVGINGAKLNMTRPEIKDLLGQPQHTVHGMNDFGAFTVFKYYRLDVTFQGNSGATAVSTTRKRQKTGRGIGPGSTVHAFKTAYPFGRCRTEFDGFRHCWLGKFRAGERVTDFRVFNDKITRVTVAFVID
ncbi:MAG TPA: hypothetical protein VH306_11120 [Gaiellaceae bacterium]